MTDDNGPLYKAVSAAGAQAVAPVAAATGAALPQDSGALAADVRVTSSKSGAAVRMIRTSIRYAGWVRFGGTRKAPHTSTRTYLSQGRYLFPTGRSMASSVADNHGAAVVEAVDNYPWTNTGTDPDGVHDPAARPPSRCRRRCTWPRRSRRRCCPPSGLLTCWPASSRSPSPSSAKPSRSVSWRSGLCCATTRATTPSPCGAHHHDVECEVIEADPTTGNGATPSPPSAATGAAYQAT